MIAPLRRRHRWLIATLTVVVPVLFVVALTGRPAGPAIGTLPAELAETARGRVESEHDDLFAHPIITRIRATDAEWLVELQPREPLAKPELLVYWTAEATSGDERLPAGAYLIGSLAGTRSRVYTMPEQTLGQAGRLLLYSLGHQEVVDAGDLPAIGSPPPDPAVEDPDAEDDTAEDSTGVAS